MHITNNLLSMILAIAAGSPDTLVIAAPIPEQAVVAVRNIVEGLPTCAVGFCLTLFPTSTIFKNNSRARSNARRL